MDSPQDTSVLRRLSRLVGQVALTAAAVAVSLYATRRRPDPEKSHETSVDESAGESDDDAGALEGLTADELYPVAQRLGITGRATMDQAQLVEALQAAGIHDLADVESVLEETTTEHATEELADDVADTGEATSSEEPAVETDNEMNAARPLGELTVHELYRVAQRLDIAGRSTMRKSQLVEALQAEGIDTAEIKPQDLSQRS